MSKSLILKTRILTVLLYLLFNHNSYAKNDLTMDTGSHIDHDGHLELKISIDENIIQQDYPFSILVELTNTGNDDIIINQRFYYVGPDIYVNIYDASGYQLKFVPHEPPPPLTDEIFQPLGSHEKISFHIKNIALGLYDKLRSGDYSINIVYKNTLGQDRGVWVGEIKSNTLRFTVEGGE